MEETYTWIKKGAAHFKFKGERIKPGVPFKARVSELPLGAMDLFEKQEEKAPPQPEPYMERLTGAWWNVFDGDGKKVNDRGIKKGEADKLLKVLKNEITT